MIDNNKKILGYSALGIAVVVGGYYAIDYFVVKDDTGKTKFKTKKDANEADKFQEEHHETNTNNGASNPPAPVNSSFPLSTGARGTLVKSLQGGLINMGISLGKYGADGIFGNATLEALKQAGYNSPVPKADYDSILAGKKKTAPVKTNTITPPKNTGSKKLDDYVGKWVFAPATPTYVYYVDGNGEYKKYKKGDKIGWMGSSVGSAGKHRINGAGDNSYFGVWMYDGTLKNAFGI